MSENGISRRSFIAGGIATAAIVGTSGALGIGTRAMAQASETDEDEASVIHALCDGCSSECGFTAWITGENVTKQIGDIAHPAAKGALCTFGYCYADALEKDYLIEKPLKRTASGTFETIDWSQAYSEIGDLLRGVIDKNGASALALVHGRGTTGAYYGTRLMNALGSSNVYSLESLEHASRQAGIAQVVGRDFESDLDNAHMVMFFGHSSTDTFSPSEVQRLEQAHSRGAHLVFVDPRRDLASTFATEWVPLIPGTDLAFILGMSHVLAGTGRYDQDFIENNVSGFAEWKEYIDSCTPAWAEGICGVSADTIARLATEMAADAPSASIYMAKDAMADAAYAKPGELGRAVAMFNTLLGCWDKTGGALTVSTIPADPQDGSGIPSVPAVKNPPYGKSENPLSQDTSVLCALDGIQNGSIKAMFVVDGDIVGSCNDSAYTAACLDQLDLCVAVGPCMNETFRHAHFILPEVDSTEREDLPQFIDGVRPAVALRGKMRDSTRSEAKSCDEIICEISKTSGVENLFTFSVDELAEAQLAHVGYSLADLRQSGTVLLSEASRTANEATVWNTPTGKIQFSSQACADAGLSPFPRWDEDPLELGENEAYLIGGGLMPLGDPETSCRAKVSEIQEDYILDRIWINPQTAEAMGIVEGDKVEISNGVCTGTCAVHLTGCTRPDVLYLPDPFSLVSPVEEKAAEEHLRKGMFSSFEIDRGYGGICTSATVVAVKKVGA